MPKRKIVITAADRRRLEAMLKSEFAEIVGPRGHLYDLKAELDCATILRPDDAPHDVVTMNSTIVLRDLDTQDVESYTLVYPEQADIANGKLSVLAPIGTAVLGQRVGDVLRWHVPAGRRRLKIEQVVYQPERAGAFISNPWVVATILVGWWVDHPRLPWRTNEWLRDSGRTICSNRVAGGISERRQAWS